MALDGNIGKTAKTPDETSSSVNLNSVSAERQPSKAPVQVADGQVFNRNRGQDQPHPNGRANPFDGADAFHAVTGKDAPASPGPVEPWRDKVKELQAHRDADGDKMQGEIHAAIAPPVRGNAITVGFADNSARATQLAKNWDLIGQASGAEGIGGSAAVFLGIPATAFAVGQFSSWKKKQDLNSDRAQTEPIHQKHRAEVVKLKDATDKEFSEIEHDANKFERRKVLTEKSEFLRDFMKGDRDNLARLSQFNKDRPTAFSTEERASLKNMATSEEKLINIKDGLSKTSDMTGFKGFYERGKSGMWQGLKYVAGTFALNEAFKYGMHVLPGDHHETDRIFSQNAQESTIQGIIGASPFRSNSTKLGIAGAAWLTAREEKMTNTESVVTTIGAMGATALAGLAIPSFRGQATKEFAEESATLLKSPMGKTLMAEAGAFGLGRLVNWSGLGTQIPELQNTSTDAWNSMKTDSEKMTGSSLGNAVDKFTELGGKWQGVLAAYTRDITAGSAKGSLPLVHGNADVLQNYQNIVINGRTGMALNEALGNSVLKSGFTEDTTSDLLGTFRAQSANDKPATDNIIVAPNQGDLDLTSRAGRSYMQAIKDADATVENMKAGQNATDDTSGNHFTDAQIKAVSDEKDKMVQAFREKILRSTDGAEAHDIKDIVEKTQGLDARSYKYTLTDYAAHDQHTYDHIVNKLEDKALLARDSWLPKQQNGPNAEVSKEYVAKIFRDAAVMRLGWMNYALNTQEGHSSAPSGLSVTDMRIYMSGSRLGDMVDGPKADRNVESIIGAANQLDPNNPDMKAIVVEYKRIQERLAATDATYKANHGGVGETYNPIANPFGVAKPANAN